MKIDKLYLKDWRNSEQSEISFSPSTTLIYGENAAGKTNLLEGISFFAAGKSFRGCKDKELIRFGCDTAHAEIGYTSLGVKNKMSVRLTKNQKKVMCKNDVTVTKLSEFLGAFRCVIFTPDHLELIKGAPEGRRRFTDMAICQSFPRHVAALNEYNRLLVQKNAHLKGDYIVPELLDVYDERMSVLAASITINRRKYLAALEESASGFLYELSGSKEALHVMYVSGAEGNTAAEIRECYKAIFKAKRDAERERRQTLVGPQKDDFITLINRRSAKTYGSQGQQRSVVLALKLAEGEISKTLTGEYPVFLFDDVLSELDEQRKNYILNRVTDRQVIITGCDEGIKNMLAEAKVVRVDKGRIV